MYYTLYTVKSSYKTIFPKKLMPFEKKYKKLLYVVQIKGL